MIALWLFAVAALIYLMVLLGGATRLTESGLSITEWKPVTGALPPLSQADWDAAFEAYKEIPEYQLVNKGMTLAQFKTIFYWEWAHRLLGRLIGAAFLLPLIFFWVTRRLDRTLAAPLLVIFVLGGLQGALGWFMVASGLSDRVDVSHYRLAAHFTFALLLYGVILNFALRLWNPAPIMPGEAERAKVGRLFGPAMALATLIFVELVYGAFTAGLDAGHASNTWPLMNGGIIPMGLFTMGPWAVNLVENPLTVQFIHRMIAYTIFAVALVLWFGARGEGGAATARLTLILVIAVLLQMALGITTVLLEVPIHVALTHQAGAVAVFTVTVILLHHMTAVRRVSKGLGE